MGETTLRRILVAAIVIVAAAPMAGCSSAYTMAREVARTVQEVNERRALEVVLERRFRPQLTGMFSNAEVGHVRCFNPPDMSGEDITRCFVSVGSATMPILAQLNPTDRHLNTALGLTILERHRLEQFTSIQMAATYGVQVQVSCRVPSSFITTPGFHTTCAVVRPSSIGKTVDVYVLDTNGWTQPVAAPRPPDEQARLVPSVMSNIKRIPGKVVAAILLHRLRAMFAALGHGDTVADVKCPKVLDLSRSLIKQCLVEFDGQEAPERVVLLNNRLAFRFDGASIDMPRITKDYEGELRRQFHASSNTRISIDCGTQRTVILTGMGYHWCEIKAPPGYPKRLVLAELDEDGHYDVFFSDYSQSATQ